MLEEAAIAADISARFDHVLVDEYQDTNRLQATILAALKPDGYGLVVVGDDAQSIYSFRAATVRNILDFPSQFSPPAAIITLEQNLSVERANPCRFQRGHRTCPKSATARIFGRTVAAVTSQPSLLSPTRPAKPITLPTASSKAVREGVALKEQAVLFRTSHHSGPLEIELTRRNIPFVKFGGLKFLEAAHVKDVLAVLRFVENPRDRVAGFRVLQLLPGVGPSTAAEFLDRLSETTDIATAFDGYRPPSRAINCWLDFARLTQDIRGEQAPWPSDLERVRLWYEPHLERIHDDAIVRRI